MPAKKTSKKRDENGRYTKEEVAVVSSLGVNDTPEPTTPVEKVTAHGNTITCLLYTSPSPRDGLLSRMPSSA